MPCQEPPVAMSTWQASIRVPEDCSVLMSGNELCGKTPAVEGQGEVACAPVFLIFSHKTVRGIVTSGSKNPLHARLA